MTKTAEELAAYVEELISIRGYLWDGHDPFAEKTPHVQTMELVATTLRTQAAEIESNRKALQNFVDTCREIECDNTTADQTLERALLVATAALERVATTAKVGVE